ncbi:MAG: restriction endonuclease subunit S, partial [Myxococcales bacterium]|nr:restriction endonuclease subunit S [Myxococcales bacterium]
ELRPAFGAFVRNRERNTGMREQIVLSLSYGRIIIKPTDKLHGLVPESFETYQIVNPGNIILRTTDLQNDHNSLRVGIVRNRGIITSAYLALRVNTGVSSEFGFQVLNVWDSSKAIYGYGSGLRQNLDFSHFKRMPVAVPPPDEQAAIVKFLDWANGRLERTIRAKRKVIALLNEQKQAIIHRAVTRGLDPNVPLKDSGIPWLGEIPAHWEVVRIKCLLREIDERSASGSEQLLSMRMHYGLVPFADHFTRAPQAATLIGFKVVRVGQLVVNRMQAGNGVIFASNLTGLVSPDYAVFDPIADANVYFLSELFRSRIVRGLFRAESKGLGTGTSGFLRLYNDRFGAIHVALPPSSEQLAILRELDQDLSGMNLTISRLEREIELLREYRTRLISDVVTGKLDVREAVAALPDEETLDVMSDDAELNDDAEPLDEELEP